MIIRASFFQICFFLLYSAGRSDGGLTLDGVNCGQKVCNRFDYCSEYDRTCMPCARICDKSTHNYEPSLCMKDCQDYLHDQRYVLKDDIGASGNLRETVQRLSHMVTVNLTLVCFMLIVLAAVLLFQLYRWKKKKNITLSTIKSKFFKRKSDANSNKPPGSGEKPDLRLEIPDPSNRSDLSPVTATTGISRRPAEDSTLDYAYDNPGMTTPSPTH